MFLIWPLQIRVLFGERSLARRPLRRSSCLEKVGLLVYLCQLEFLGFGFFRVLTGGGRGKPRVRQGCVLSVTLNLEVPKFS